MTPVGCRYGRVLRQYFFVVVSHRALALPLLSSPTKNLHFTSFETLKSFYKTKTKKSEWDFQDYSLWRRLSCPTVRETFLHRDFYEDFLFQENMQTEVIRGQVGSFKGTREGLKMDQIGSEICQFLSNGPINKVLFIRIYDFIINWTYLDQNYRNIWYKFILLKFLNFLGEI